MEEILQFWFGADDAEGLSFVDHTARWWKKDERFDETIPLTSNEFDEWGNPKDRAYYDYMLSYSPYDNVEAKPYPSLLVTTGLWDSQVQYFEPAKWVAKLRARKTDDNLLLLSTEMEAGHHGRSGRYRRFEDTARDFAFVLHVLDRPDSRFNSL